jgi:hypothetical protein
VNLYGIVENSATNYVDYLGEMKIKVGNCQAYLWIGHSTGKPIEWEFPKTGCGGVGGAIVCHPERNNNVPASPDDTSNESRKNNWPNIPQHDNNLYPPKNSPSTGEPTGASGTMNDDLIDRRNEENEPNFENSKSAEHNFDQAVLNALNGASFKEIKDRLCKCCSKTGIDVTIYLESSGQTKNPQDRFGLNHKENKMHLDCPK